MPDDKTKTGGDGDDPRGARADRAARLLTSEEAINARYGPTFGGYAEAICEALAKLR